MSLWTDLPSAPASPEVLAHPAQPYLALTVEATMSEWGEVNARIGLLGEWMGARGLTPAGPPFYRYRVVGGRHGLWEVEVAFPIHDEDVATARDAVTGEDVTAGEIEAGRYASWLHHGHPDRLAGVHDALQAWIREQGEQRDSRISGGVERWGGVYDVFLTDPAVRPDPADWDTLVACRLA